MRFLVAAIVLAGGCGSGPPASVQAATVAVCDQPSGLIEVERKCAGTTSSGQSCYLCAQHSACDFFSDGSIADHCVDWRFGCDDPACRPVVPPR